MDNNLNMLPEDFKIRMKHILKEDYENFLNTYSREPFKAIRVNTLKVSLENFIDISPFKITGSVPWEKRGLYINDEKPGRHPYHEAGLFYVQEPSAMSVIPCAGIEKNQKVLDLCAAPGGKSTQAAADLNSTGLIVSNEIDGKRAKILSQNIERMGITNAVVTNNSPSELEKYFKSYFDRIIVDAPCSGEGMFKKEKAALSNWSLENIEGCSIRQGAILDSAAKMLKAGGYIAYSTCTFSLEENEMVIDRFLKLHKEFEIIEIEKKHGFRGGFTENTYSMNLNFAARLLPQNIKGEGHFIALLRKKDGSCEIPRLLVSNAKSETIKDYYEFCSQNLNETLNDRLYISGDNLYCLPDGLCDIKGLRILRAGLFLGTFKKNRFEPNHAFALALKKENAKRIINLKSDEDGIISYLKGNTLNVKEDNGWCLVCVDGFSTGWGKISSNIMKNHFPKGLRW
jgi:NOL1/NOP2/sun family putative RNA methylase